MCGVRVQSAENDRDVRQFSVQLLDYILVQIQQIALEVGDRTRDQKCSGDDKQVTREENQESGQSCVAVGQEDSKFSSASCVLKLLQGCELKCLCWHISKYKKGYSY